MQLLHLDKTSNFNIVLQSLELHYCGVVLRIQDYDVRYAYITYTLIKCIASNQFERRQNVLPVSPTDDLNITLLTTISNAHVYGEFV